MRMRVGICLGRGFCETDRWVCVCVCVCVCAWIVGCGLCVVFVYISVIVQQSSERIALMAQTLGCRCASDMNNWRYRRFRPSIDRRNLIIEVLRSVLSRGIALSPY